MKHLRSSLSLCLSALVSACATTADESDTTAPEVELYFGFDGDDALNEVPASGLDLAFGGELLGLMAVGTDPGGVQRVEIEVTGGVTCECQGSEYFHRPYVVDEVEDPSVEHGDRTVSSRILITLFPAGRACEDEAHDYLRGSLTAVARARNFASGETTSGTLTLSR